MKNDYAFQEQANTAFRKANILREQGCVRSAISIYNELLNVCSDVSAQGLLTWALGSLHWGDAGNGEESRRFFKENVALYEKHKELQKAEKAHLWAANSCENLMLLSLSYEEYDVWAEKLKSLQPKNDILQIQVPEVHESRDRAFPWVRVMQGIMAYPILQTATPQSTGRVASGAAILQLILKNRKKLRVPLDVWQETVMNYTQAIVMTAEHCYTRINESGGVMDPDEFLFIVDDSIPLVEEYVRANPSNSEVQEGLAQMKKDQENFRQEKGQQVETHTLVEFQWEMNPALEEAIRDTGVQGLQFKLVKVGIDKEMNLKMKFRPCGPVPRGKERMAGLALRCVFGFTFPNVVSAVPNFQVLLRPDAEYYVDLGSGVPLRAYWIQFGEYRLGPFQMTSYESFGKYYVVVKPISFQTVESNHIMHKKEELFTQLIPEFKKLKRKIIRLTG